MQLEKQVIAELIFTNKKETRLDGLSELEGYSFKDKFCATVYSSILYLSLQRKEVDTISIYHHNQVINLIELSKLQTEYISDAYLMQHIYLLKSKQFKNKIASIIQSNLEQIKLGEFGEDIEEIKNSLIIELSGLSMEDRSDFEDLNVHKMKIREQFNSNKSIEGFSWGILDLDKWTSGIILPRVYVIGGLKKGGKTRFLVHTLKQLHQQKVPTVFLSLEMPGYEVTKLLHSSFTNLNDLLFRSSALISNEQKAKFDDVNINSEFLSVECKAGLSIEKILSRIRRYSKMGFKVIAIDYLQRINHNRNKQAQELEDISIRLADSARQFNVSLILLSQLNAEGEKEIPNMGHLKGSGGIGESADTILLLDNLYRRTKKLENEGKMDIYIEQRHGDSGKLSLQCDLGACQFRDFISRTLSNQII